MFRTIDLHKFGGSINKMLSEEITDLEHKICRVLVATGLDLMEPKVKRDVARSSLNETVDALLYSRFYRIDNKFNAILNDIGLQEHNFIHRQLSDVSSKKCNPLLHEDILQTVSRPLIAGKDIRYWGDNTRRILRRDINTKIDTELSEGATTVDVIKKLKGDKTYGYRNGAFRSVLGKLQTLFRSGITSVTNDIRQRLYSKNAHLIKSFYWNSTLDGNSSSICNHSHNSTWEVPSLTPQGNISVYRSGSPHFNCRSTIVPLFRDNSAILQDEYGGTIKEWIKSRSDREHRTIFGSKKYSLWKKEKISYPQLVNFKTTPITIHDLNMRYGA